MSDQIREGTKYRLARRLISAARGMDMLYSQQSPGRPELINDPDFVQEVIDEVNEQTTTFQLDNLETFMRQVLERRN